MSAGEVKFSAVPDGTTRRWMVKWEDARLRLTDEEYHALKRAAVDDPVEAQRLAAEYLARGDDDTP